MEIYFDNSATTRCYDSVKDIVVKTMTEDFGNPSAMHLKGVDAEKYVKESAKTIAGILKVQEKEIAEMKELLKPLGGIEESAYAPMKKAMQHMLEEGKNLGANMRFVELMLPHHAMALEMSVPALLGSNNPQILNLAENIIISQAKEMRQFKAWIAEHHKK